MFHSALETKVKNSSYRNHVRPTPFFDLIHHLWMFE